MAGVVFKFGLFICVFSVPNRPDDKIGPFNFKQNTVITRPQAINIVRCIELLDLAREAALETRDLGFDLALNLGRECQKLGLALLGVKNPVRHLRIKASARTAPKVGRQRQGFNGS